MAFRKVQTTNLVSTETSFDDPVLVVNKSSTSTNIDVGFLAKRGINTYSGIVRDGDDSKFYVVESVTLGSSATNDVNPALVTVGTLVADVEIGSKIVLPKGTTVQRPSSPEEGQLWFNTDTKMFEGYNGTAWVQLVPSTYTES